MYLLDTPLSSFPELDTTVSSKLLDSKLLGPLYHVYSDQ